MSNNLDDLPVGGGGGESNSNKNGGAGAIDEMGGGGASTTSASSSAGNDANAPLEQRLVSKNWQVRAKAFEEIIA